MLVPVALLIAWSAYCSADKTEANRNSRQLTFSVNDFDYLLYSDQFKDFDVSISNNEQDRIHVIDKVAEEQAPVERKVSVPADQLQVTPVDKKFFEPYKVPVPISRYPQERVIHVPIPFPMEEPFEIRMLIAYPVEIQNLVAVPYPLLKAPSVPVENAVIVTKPYSVDKNLKYPTKQLSDNPVTYKEDKPYFTIREKEVRPVKVEVVRPVPYDKVVPYNVNVPVLIPIPRESNIQYRTQKPVKNPVPVEIIEEVPVPAEKPYGERISLSTPFQEEKSTVKEERAAKNENVANNSGLKEGSEQGKKVGKRINTPKETKEENET